MANIGDGLTAGANFFQGLIDQQRKTAAYNALRDVYGDAAGDPQAALQMQTYGQREQLFPGSLDEQRLGNAQTAAQIPNIQANTAQTQSQTATLDQERARAETLRAAVALEAVRAQGGDVGAEFDRIVGPNAAAFGLTPESLPKWKQAITTDPRVLPAIIKGLQAQDQDQNQSNRWQQFADPQGRMWRTDGSGGPAQPVLGPDGQQLRSAQAVQAQERLGQGDRRLDIASPSGQRDVYRERQVGEAEGKNEAADLPLSGTQRVQAAAAHDSAKQAYELGIFQIGKALDDVTWKSTGVMSATRFFPGTPAADLNVRISGIAARAVLDTMREMKAMSANGSTGFGQLVTREEEIMAARYGDFQKAASPSLKREMLETLRDQLKMSWERAERAYKADIAARGEGAAPSGQFQDGKVYEDAQGNKARYQGGQWVPVQ